MKRTVCIAGAGPGGLLLGKELARAGMEVIILEACTEDAYYQKYSWSDALELCMLKDAELPIPFAKGNRWCGHGVKGQSTGLELYEPYRVSELGIYSPDYSQHTATDVDFRFIITDRTALAQVQMEQTRASGAKIRFGCKVADLLGDTQVSLGDVTVMGVVVEQDGKRENITADLVVDATGQSASLRTLLAAVEISQPFNSNQYGLVHRTVQKCETTDIDASHADWEHPPFRNHYRLRTPKGYLFFHPHSEDEVDVGGGAIDQEEAVLNVQGVLSKLPGMLGIEVGHAMEKNLKCMPPDALVATGFLVIGHAAGQVHPTHGCGISTAYMGALLAAQVIRRANDFHISTLWEYNHRWMSAQGAHFAALFHRLKNLEADEVSFLLENNIINGETTTNDYNGNYLPPNVNELRRLEEVYPKNPALMEKWIRAEEESRRSFFYYNSYPPIWNQFALTKWRLAAPGR